MLVDTVGFVRHLPHELVESFHATLEETLEADLLLHVIDSSREDMHEQILAVQSVLAQINNDVPVLNVFNKIDITGEPPHIVYDKEYEPNRVYLSARTGTGIDNLTFAVEQLLLGKMEQFVLTLSPSNKAHAKLQNELHQLSVIQTTNYDDNGNIVLNVRLASGRLLQLLGQYHIEPKAVLSSLELARILPILEPFELAQKHKVSDLDNKEYD